MNNALRIIAASAFLTGLLIKAVPALSEPAAAAQAVSVVRTADLDLSTPAGRQALDRRLEAAVVEACGTAANVDLEGRNAVRHCRRDKLAEARARSDSLLAQAARAPEPRTAAR